MKSFKNVLSYMNISTFSYKCCRFITLFKSVAGFCGTTNILQNIPTFRLNGGIFRRILSIPQNIVMDLKNVRFMMLRF
jgi:hypothetical protein